MDASGQVKPLWISISERSAEQYMLSYLEEGHSLSKALARSIRGVPGGISALVPELANTGKILDFETAGLMPWIEPIVVDGGRIVPVRPPDGELARCIGAMLSEAPGTSCLVEDYLAGPTDPFLATVPVHFVSLDQEVYFALALRDLSSPIGGYLSWHFTLGVGSSEKDLSATEMLSPGDIEIFAASSQLVVIRAYDGDGYLVWQRSTDVGDSGSPSG
jgi:hypothetical protein